MTFITCHPPGTAYAGDSPGLAMTLLTLAVGLTGFTYAGEQCAMLDIAPSLAGTLMGIINALGNTMGFVAPMIVGYIISSHNDAGHWKVGTENALDTCKIAKCVSCLF